MARKRYKPEEIVAKLRQVFGREKVERRQLTSEMLRQAPSTGLRGVTSN
jgi:hypothetical protein